MKIPYFRISHVSSGHAQYIMTHDIVFEMSFASNTEYFEGPAHVHLYTSFFLDSTVCIEPEVSSVEHVAHITLKP